MKAASRLVNRTVNGNSVEIYVNSRILSDNSASLEVFEGGMEVYEDDSSFEDEVELLIKINDDSLKISCELRAKSK